MDAQTVTLVEDSWQKVAPIAPQAAELFYRNLFEADPALEALFQGDMQAQGRKLMQMIGAAVGLLRKPDALIPVLQQLGGRHAGYGVQDSHYQTVGGALLKTLRQGLGDDFTPDVHRAWADVYGVMADVMIKAGR